VTKLSPVPAFVALGVTIVAGTALIGDVSIGSFRVTAAFAGAFAAAGFLFSWARWQPERAMATPINLALCLGSAFLLTITRATVDIEDPPGGLHAMAEVFVVVLALRSFALIDVNRLRSALLLSMGALLGGAATADVGTAMPWLVVWLLGAVACLVAIGEVASSELPMLGGARPIPRPQWLRRGRDAALIVAAVVVAALAVVVVDPTPGRGSPHIGRDPGSQRAAPYVNHSSTLDTGKRFTLSDEIIMKVRASAPDFWRGQSFDRWDGRVWRRSPLTDSSFPVGREGFVPAAIGDQEGGGETFVQQIRVEAPYMQAIFGAYRVDEIDTALGGVTVHGDGSIELRQPIGPGTEYTVISLRQPVTPEFLRTHDPIRASVPPYISSLYLQLPSKVPARVTALAHELTDTQPTAYDKVRAIERWLDTNTTYTLDIPALPDGADAVEQHLFVDKRGYCEQIATSTAVLLRSVGVPARVAVGFVPGDESLLGGEFTVRAKDAHAWVEVWFPGVGWQAFDPTADVPLAGDSTRTAVQRALDLLQRLAPLLALLAFVVALGVAAWFAWRSITARRVVARAPWAQRYLRELEAAGAAKGRPRAPPETPAEYAAALDPHLVEAGRVLTRAVYGPAEPSAEERAIAEALLESYSTQ
jgi:transglutaminase-like putative cysteine protease